MKVLRYRGEEGFKTLHVRLRAISYVKFCRGTSLSAHTILQDTLLVKPVAIHDVLMGKHGEGKRNPGRFQGRDLYSQTR
jgi:hypothetical protein